MQKTLHQIFKPFAFFLLLFTGLAAFAQTDIIPVRNQVSGFSTWTDTDVAGSTYLQLLKATSSTITPAMNFNTYTGESLVFTARTYGGNSTAENTITVSISTDNGSSWTVLGTRRPTSTSLVAQQAFDLSSYNGTQVKIRFTMGGTSDGVGAGIDDITITGNEITGPSIVTTEASYGPFCNTQPNNISVAYTTTGSFTGSFGVQLSNASGIFPNDATSNLLTVSGTSSPLTATLPSALAAGNYRVRVVNSAPATFSLNNNGSDIVINEITTAEITALEASSITAVSAQLSAMIGDIGCSAVTNYGVAYSTEAGFADGEGTIVIGTNLSGSLFSVSLSGLAPGTTYYYKALAVNGGGMGYSTQMQFTTEAVDTPVAVAATDTTNTSFTANWEAAAGATSYRLDVATDNAFETSEPGDSFTETFTSIGGGNISTYLTRSWTGVNSITWEVSDTRTDQALNGDAITIRTGSLTNITPIAGGLAQIEFSYARAYTGNSTLQVFINGEQYGGDITVSSTNATIFSVPVNVVGDIYIEIVNSGNRTIIDDLKLTALDIAVPYYVDGYANLNVGNVTSYEVTGLDANTTYYYRVRAVSGSAVSDNSNDVSATTLNPVVWTSNGWMQDGVASNVPALTDDVLIDADYNFGEGTEEDGIFMAKTLRIASGIFTVKSGANLRVSNGIYNDTGAENFVVENNAHIIQENEVDNQGEFTVWKNSNPLFRQDYTIWSAPVTGQNLQEFSEETLSNRFYTYNPIDSEYVAINPSNNFVPGNGYMIRMPNTDPAAGYDAGTATLVFQGKFVGELNNAPVTVTLTEGGDYYNMVGNPFPSPINIHSFFDININAIDNASALYFWRKKNGNGGTSYATITKLAYTANTSQPEYGDTGGDAFEDGNQQNWVLNPGQGFFVKAKQNAASLIFTNSMRREVNNNQFFRHQPGQDSGNGISTIKLNMSKNDSSADFSQAVIGYTDVTTTGLDYGWDGRLLNDGKVRLYTKVNDVKLAIQARAQFEDTDIVPLEFKATEAGNYTISLKSFAGVFAGQDIFLKDNMLNVTHNLKNGDYSFTTDAGIYAERFEVVYVNEALGTDNPSFNANTVIVYTSGTNLVVNSGSQLLKSVNVFDLRGRLLYAADNINAAELTVSSLQPAKQPLIVKANTEAGTVSKKVIY
ncbi:T9SS sorting signal type C domain-containing protein [Flavobacterium sp. MK4S-17]|uniref:T9SS sorting signal type C domain-containing protein n=1 Tax=Flavobacterium sp. MK4S-17 TaxID=2543737 RepID=UPI00135ABEA2|nr:T9SS sorting signal type C domain-containing protein [Flavobacterium sp. MK4S-17]